MPDSPLPDPSAAKAPAGRPFLQRRRWAAAVAVGAVLLVGLLVLSIPSAAFAAEGDFTEAPGSPEQAGTNSNSVAVGDFNEDGERDLAVANLSSDNVTILLGDGTGNFTAAATSPEVAGDEPISVEVGKFDGDGDQDLAVANFNSDNVTILLGDGTGNFTAAAASPEAAGDGPIEVAVGNFDGDGDQDLAVANRNSNDVTILLGVGSGNFLAAGTSPEGAGTANANPTSVAVGNFDGDADQDLAVTNQNFVSVPDTVTILLGDGTGNFTALSPEAVGGANADPRSVAVGNFNGDGDQDLAVANIGANNVTILLGAAGGDFTAAPTSPEGAGDGPRSVAVGNFNGDGDQDLAVANADGTVTILLGDGSGDFSAPPTSPEAAGHSPQELAVGNFNNDGDPDLAIANGVTFTPTPPEEDVTILLGSIPDSDGDGLDDDRDRCPTVFANTASGCPVFPRELTIRYVTSAAAFRGNLSSSEPQCEEGELVSVYKKRAGRDRKVGDDLTDANGNYSVPNAGRRGSYYAQVGQSLEAGVGICQAERSPTIKR